MCLNFWIVNDPCIDLGGACVGNLIFLVEKCTVGVVGTVAVSTNRFVGAADTVAAPTN